MADQHVKLLQGLGVEQSLIDEVEKVEADKAKDWDPSKVTDAVKSAMKNNFLNDNDFLNAIPEDKVPEATKKKIEAGQYTRFQKELLETATKQLGLDDSDLADLTDEEKKSIKKTMAKIAEKHLVKKGNVEGLKKMQEELRKANELLENKDADWQKKVDNEVETTKGAYSSKLLKGLLKAEIATVSGVELTVPASYVTEPMLQKLSSKYAIIVDDNNELQLRQKVNPALEVNEGSKKITFQDALKKQLIEDKVAKEIVAEDPKDKNKKKRIVIGNDEEGGEQEETIIAGNIMDKINKNKELEEKE